MEASLVIITRLSVDLVGSPKIGDGDVEGDGDLSRACGANTGLVGLRDVDLRPITIGDTTNLIIGEPVTSGDTCLFPTIGGLNRFAGLCLLISARLFNGELVGDFC